MAGQTGANHTVGISGIGFKIDSRPPTSAFNPVRCKIFCFRLAALRRIQLLWDWSISENAKKVEELVGGVSRLN